MDFFHKFLLVALTVAYLFSIQNNLCASPSVVTTSRTQMIKVRFNSNTLRGRVAESMSHAEKSDLSYIDTLVDIYKDHPDLLVSTIETYKSDKDENIRYAVIWTCSRIKTKKSLDLLIYMMGDLSIRQDAVDSIYSTYTYSEIISFSSKRLRSALLRYFVLNRDSTSSTLLLSCFRLDSKTQNILVSRRSGLIQEKSNNTDEIMCIDICLSEMGRDEYVEQVRQSIKNDPVKSSISLLNNLKFVRNKEVLLLAIVLLRNKTNVVRTGLADGPTIYIRVCDKAMTSLHEKFYPRALPSLTSPRRFTDAELDAAFKRYKAKVAASPN